MKKLYQHIFKIILSGIVINAVLFLIYFATNSFSYSVFSSITKEYVLQPIDYKVFHLDISQKYLEANISPLSIRYFFMDIEEQLTPKINNLIYFTFSLKRLQELARWGNILRIEGKFNNAVELKNWYKNSFFNYDSWEAGFARYLILIEKQIDFFSFKIKDKKDQLTNLLNLYNYLIYYQQEFNPIIVRSVKTIDEKIYLKQITNKIFNYLYSKIESRTFSISPLTSHYSLYDLIKNKQYGIYEAFIEQKAELLKFKEIMLSLNNQKYKNENLENNQKIVFKNLEINENTPILSLILPKINILQNQKWQIRKQDNQLFEYSLPIPSYNAKNTYHFLIENKTDDIKILQLEQIINDQTLKPITIFSDYLFPNKNSNKINQSINFIDQKEASSASVVLVSPKNLSGENLSKFKVELIPRYTPEIILKKIKDYDDNNSKVSSDSKIFLNKTAKTLLTLLNLFLGFYLFYLFYKLLILNFRNKNPYILKKIKTIKRKTSEKLIKLRSVMLIIVTFGISVEIFLFQNSPDIFIIILSVLLLLTSYSFRQDARVFFIAGLIFLVLCTILLSFRKNSLAEKMAVISYIVFITGAIKAFLDLLFSSHINHWPK